MQAHEVLYRGYARPVFTLASRILDDPAQAEEVLQDTCIEIIRNVAGFREDAAFGGWVKRIATNKALAHLRSAWHRKGRRFADDEAEDPAMAGSTQGDVAVGVADQEGLARALAMLTPAARAVVWLYDVEGFSHEEIAALMGKSISFSKSRLARAHRQLRALLAEDEEVQPCMRQPNSC
nr:RNA polymerase sigma factor [Wenzhouxiangella sp. XN24]